jgi:hypothetical protein
MIASGAVKRFSFLLVASAAMLLPWQAAARGINESVELLMQMNKASARAQVTVDKLSEKTTNLMADYRGVLQQIESIQTYNAQVKALIASQEAEIAKFDSEIDRATNIGREVSPLMDRMVKSLKYFVELDVPFLEHERKERIESLEKLMVNANVSESERFRRILEAYQIENEYGRKIEAYLGNHPTKTDTKVNYLQFGRVALVYLNQDESEAGAYDIPNREWIPLPGEYIRFVKHALRVARSQTTPDLVRIPIFAAEDK